MSRPKTSRMEAFLSRVEWRGECLIWLGGKNQCGYGRFWDGEKRVCAHRWLYEQTVGEFPAHLHSLHSCDTPSCVNPKHITPGTPLENTRDMIAKGRARYVSPRGTDRPCKLTEEGVLSIRTRVHAGELQTAIAREFGVSVSLIAHVIVGDAWPHVGGPIGLTGRKGRSGRPRKQQALAA